MTDKSLKILNDLIITGMYGMMVDKPLQIGTRVAVRFHDKASGHIHFEDGIVVDMIEANGATMYEVARKSGENIRTSQRYLDISGLSAEELEYLFNDEVAVKAALNSLYGCRGGIER